MARFDEAFLQEVRDRNEIVGLVGEYVHLTRRGSRYLGLCPFHSEKTPSFSVNSEKGYYYCFGCKATGDVIRFLMEKDRLTFPEAVAFLARRAGLPLPQEDLSPEQEKEARERQQVMGALDFAARFFAHQLRHTGPGRETLAYLQGRGLTDATIDRFRLGYAPESGAALFRSAVQRFPAPVLVKAGLVIPREGGDGYYDAFRHRATFPIADIRGKVIAFGGRALRSEQNPKYYNSRESTYFTKRMHLYALDLAKDAMRAEDKAIVVEGYMDAIALHQAGFTNAVASMGTSLTREHADLLRRQCGQVIIAYDADVAGQQAALRGFDILVQAGLDLRVLTVPDGKDPDEYIKARGADAFRELLRGAQPLIEYRIRAAQALNKRTGNAAEIHAAVMHSVVPILAQIRDPVLRDQYTRQAAHWMNLSSVTEESLRISIKEHLDKAAKSSSGRYSPSKNWNNIKVLGDAAAGQTPGGLEPAYRPLPAQAGTGARAIRVDPLVPLERALLRLLLHYPRLAAQTQVPMAGHPWTLKEHADLYKALVAQAAGPADSLVARLLAGAEEPRAGALVAELEAEGTYIVQPERELPDVLDSLRKERDQRRLRELRDIFKAREAAGEPVEPAFMIEYQELVRRTRR